MKSLFVSIILLSAFAFIAPQKKKITIWMIGDSTMSVKDKKAYPENGWGMPFVYFWDTTVKVENLAQNGRSTRTFLEEGRWTPVMNQMQEGDYVIIQFAHNDEVPTKKSYVTEKDFKANLLKYVNDTRSKKGTPILLTPMARRKFDSTGNIQETHAVYAQIIRDVAKENKVLMIDMSEISKSLLQQLGPKGSIFLYNHLEPGEHPNYPEGKIDDTHFSELGARRLAELVLAEIRKIAPELASRIVVRTVK